MSIDDCRYRFMREYLVESYSSRLSKIVLSEEDMKEIARVDSLTHGSVTATITALSESHIACEPNEFVISMINMAGVERVLKAEWLKLTRD